MGDGCGGYWCDSPTLLGAGPPPELLPHDLRQMASASALPAPRWGPRCDPPSCSFAILALLGLSPSTGSWKEPSGTPSPATPALNLQRLNPGPTEETGFAQESHWVLGEPGWEPGLGTPASLPLDRGARGTGLRREAVRGAGLWGLARSSCPISACAALDSGHLLLHSQRLEWSGRPR